jgi:hypothetical protein
LGWQRGLTPWLGDFAGKKRLLGHEATLFDFRESNEAQLFFFSEDPVEALFL